MHSVWLYMANKRVVSLLVNAPSFSKCTSRRVFIEGKIFMRNNAMYFTGEVAMVILGTQENFAVAGEFQ